MESLGHEPMVWAEAWASVFLTSFTAGPFIDLQGPLQVVAFCDSVTLPKCQERSFLYINFPF